MTFGPANSQSSYLPSTFELNEDQKLNNESIAKRERLTASILNIKENASYELQEQLTAKQWFSTQTSGNPRKNRFGYRTVFDLVSLNGGNIPVGNTVINIGAKISAIAIPLPSTMSATLAGPIYISGPGSQLDFIFDNSDTSNQKITIINNSGAALIQLYLNFEYLKQT